MKSDAELYQELKESGVSACKLIRPDPAPIDLTVIFANRATGTNSPPGYVMFRRLKQRHKD